MTSLKELQALGAFVPDKPVKKTITFKLPNESGDMVEHSHDIHVKKLSIGEYEALFLTDKEDRSRTAALISAAITLGRDGKEAISFKDAYRLDPNLAAAMATAFNEVNFAKKPSAPATDSSAN